MELTKLFHQVLATDDQESACLSLFPPNFQLKKYIFISTTNWAEASAQSQKSGHNLPLA